MAIRPFVVSVSEFRRRLAALVDDVSSHGHPIFLTQYGTVVAVVVSCEEYRARRTEEQREGVRRDAPGFAPAIPRVPPSLRSPRLTPLPDRKIWTRLGMCDFEVAEVLAGQGIETELVWTDEGWLTDDEG